MTAVMDVAATMDALAVGTGMRNAYGYPVETGTVPCAIVGYPRDLEFHQTFGASNAQGTYPVWIVFGAVMQKSTRDAILPIMNTVRAALDALSMTITVREAEFESVHLNAVLHLACRLDCEVIS